MKASILVVAIVVIFAGLFCYSCHEKAEKYAHLYWVVKIGKSDLAKENEKLTKRIQKNTETMDMYMAILVHIEEILVKHFKCGSISANKIPGKIEELTRNAENLKSKNRELEDANAKLMRISEWMDKHSEEYDEECDGKFNCSSDGNFNHDNDSFLCSQECSNRRDGQERA